MLGESGSLCTLAMLFLSRERPVLAEARIETGT